MNRLHPDGSLDASSDDFAFTVRPVSPTYVGNDVVGIYVQDLTQGPTGNVFVTSDTPARPGDVVTIYATGLGITNPPVDAGTVPPAGTLANIVAPMSITLRSGSSQWNAEFFGAVATPQFPGLYQASFRFPLSTNPSGKTIDLALTVGADTQTFTLGFAH